MSVRNILLVCLAAAAGCPVPAEADIPASDNLVLVQAGPADRETIAEIQTLLADLGFDPGPADGQIGPKTRRAIVAWQRIAGLPDDGIPTVSLLQALRGKTDEKPDDSKSAPMPDAPVDPASTSIDPLSDNAVAAHGDAALAPDGGDIVVAPLEEALRVDQPILAGSAWRFVDDTGSAFTIKFRPDGKLEGVVYADFWKWWMNDDELSVSYDNGMGLTVTRTGTLTGPDAMEGQAIASRGQTWTWRATRIDDDN